MIPLHSLVVAPLKDEYSLQALVADLWSRKHPAATVQEYGRKGQRQNGVDVFILDAANSICTGIQCKAATSSESELTEKEINEEVEKAKKFKPTLKRFIFATTRQRDVKVQDLVNQITVSHQKVGLFSVEIVSWEDLLGDISFHPEIAQKYFTWLDWQAVTGEHRAQLEHAARLLDEYKPSEVLVYLDTFKARIWEAAEPKIKSRIHSLQAMANLLLEKIDEGNRLLIEAYELDRTNIDRLCNYAHALAVSGKENEALSICEKVIGDNPDKAQAYAIASDIWVETILLTEIVKRIPSQLHEDRSIAWKIGGLATQQDDLDLATAWLDKALAVDLKNNPDLKASLADVCLRRVVRERGFSAGEIPTTEEIVQLKKAEKLYSQALDGLGDPLLINRRAGWLLNRSVARTILGNSADAVKDVDEALTLKPEENTCLLHRAKLALIDGFGDAAHYLERIKEHHDDDSDWALLSAEAYRKLGQLDQGIAVLEQYLTNAKEGRIKQTCLRLLMENYIESRQNEKARLIAEQAHIFDSIEVLDIVLAGEFALSEGNREKALLLLTQAESQLAQKNGYQEIRQLADFAFKLTEYSRSALLYSKIAKTDANDSSTRKQVHSLLKAGDFKEAKRIAEELLKKNGPTSFVTEVFCTVFEQTGNLDAAAEVCAEYLKTHSDDFFLWVRLALIRRRQGKIEEVDKILSRNLPLKEMPLQSSMNLIRLHGSRGNYFESLKLAYELRRQKYDSAEVHNLYMSAYVFCLRQADHHLATESIGLNTTFIIKSESGTTRKFTVEERTDRRIEAGEYSPDHELIKKFWAKKKGDIVELELGKLEPEKWEVDQVVSKYVHANYESLEHFHELFPGSSGPLIISMKPDESGRPQLTDLQKVLAEQHQASESLLSYYENGLITVGQLAVSLGRNVTEVLWGLVHGQGARLFCSTGTKEEKVYSDQILHEYNSKFVLDLTAINSIILHGMGNVVAESLKGRLEVAQSTVDLILSERALVDSAQKDGYETLCLVEGQLQLIKIPESEVKRQATFYKEVIEWINNHCAIAKCGSELLMNQEERDEASETLGRSFIDSILIAKGNSYLLLSDDWPLRRLGNHGIGVNGLSTETLLSQLVDRGQVNKEHLLNYQIALMAAGYRNLQLTDELLYVALRCENWELTPKFRSLLSLLENDQLEVGSVIAVSINFIHRLWMGSAKVEKRNEVLMGLMDVICSNREPELIVKVMNRYLGIKFESSPFHAEEIKSLIEQWLKKNREPLS